jgi:hypothetical protein
MTKVFYFLTFLCLTGGAYAQQTDEKMQLKIKLALTEFTEFKSHADFCAYLEEPIQISFLEAKGFGNNLIFFKVPIVFDSMSNFRFVYNFELVMAYNKITESLYKLKGFRDNQFDQLYRDLYLISYHYFEETSEEDLSSLKRFTKHFYIEGLDLRCLYKTLKTKRPKCAWYARPLLD